MEEKEFNVTGGMANRTVKDTVFRSLFSDKKYLLRLYQALHPEDTKCTENDLKVVTLEQVLLRGIYNDLGFLAGDKFLILMEAQSTWSVNIIIRSLLYVAKTYQDYFAQSKQSLYSGRKVHMPKPELYVLYTGETKVDKEVISLSEEFFDGQESAVEVKVKVLTAGGTGNIIDQYVKFTEISNAQMKVHGRTQEAVKEVIRLCKAQNVLKEYLEIRETEVTDMLTTLYDQDEIWETFIASERREAAEEAAEKVREAAERKAAEKVRAEVKAVAEKLYAKGTAVSEIAELLGYSVEETENLLELAPQSGN